MSIILKLKVEAGKPILRGHDHFWRVIRQLTWDDSSTVFTVNDVYGESAGVTKKDVQNFIKLLEKADYVTQVAMPAHNECAQYQLNLRPIDTPVLSRTGRTKSGLVQQNLWNTMRYALKGGFTVRELQMMASTEDVPITLLTAKSYVKVLNKAGMFIMRGKGVATTYRLKPSANTGPKAPKILRSKMVFDANTGTVVGEVIAEEMGS